MAHLTKSTITLAWLASLASLAPSGACTSEWEGGIHARMGWSEAGGLRVVDVPENGPAGTAGVRPGDVIVRIDGTSVESLPVRQTIELLRGPVGARVELVVRRDGEELTFRVERAPYR